MTLNQMVMFLLLWVTIALVVGTLAGMSKLSDIHEQKIEQRLKQLNKPAVKSVHVITIYNIVTSSLLFPKILLAKCML